MHLAMRPMHHVQKVLGATRWIGAAEISDQERASPAIELVKVGVEKKFDSSRLDGGGCNAV